MSGDLTHPPVTPWLPRIVAGLVGCYLFTAAGLKLWSNGVLTIGEGVYAPALQFLAVQIEIVLGSWLILGRWRITAWISVCPFLTTLAGLSLTRALAGQSDCGCFGNLKVNPWWTTGSNFAAHGLLVVARLRVKLSENWASFVAAAAFASVVGIAVWIANGPIGASLTARWRGKVLPWPRPSSMSGKGKFRKRRP